MADEEEGPSWFAAFLTILVGIGVCALTVHIVRTADPKGFDQFVAEAQKTLGIQPKKAEPEEEPE
ncbi:MAG: hypothetical protein VKP62_01410 [Candidatus Sericytochromatia bacterium]|nr:hypothetical protein [Candidatus Sericytochromatia bacterium]